MVRLASLLHGGSEHKNAAVDNGDGVGVEIDGNRRTAYRPDGRGDFQEHAEADIGNALLDATKVDDCREMMAKAEEKGVKLLLPIDTAVADSFPNPIDAPIDVEYVDTDKIPADKEGLDIGPKTAKLFQDAVLSAKTVVWNGPMGVFENPTLAKGTIAVAQALADSSAITIVGGGDSAAACEQLGFASKITHISTGGGASLEFLEGKDLPGVSCLLDK